MSLRSLLPRPRPGALVAALALLTACTTAPPPVAERVVTPAATRTGGAWADPADWTPFVLPGKRSTAYHFDTHQGRRVIHAQADRSASMLRRVVNLPPEALKDVQFSWWVTQLMDRADVRQRETDDAPVRVVLAFDGDHGTLPLSEQMKFDLAEALTGERPPYATLMYVWERQAPPESVVVSARSSRIRKIVVESGAQQLGRWRDYRRNVAADFRRAFGEAPGRLIAVGVMTDSDNTQSVAEAWYGEIRLNP